MRRRETGLFLFAAAILAVSLFTETRRDVVAASPEKDDAARSVRPGSQMAALDVDEWLARLKARSMNATPGGQGLFGGTTWQPPAPASALPAKPQTPPFPFRLLGRMTLEGVTVIVLAKGEQSYSVKAGDVIEQFRIDRIDDDALRVTYVPNGEAKDYRKEDLYPQVAVAAVPSTPLPQQATPLPQQATPLPQQAMPVSPPAQGQATGGAGAAAPAAAPLARAAGGIATEAASGAVATPLSQMPGASAPIGGMVITPAPPGSGMLVMPTAPANLMNIAPTPPGGGMVMTPVPAGVVGPGVQATPSGSPPAPGSQ